MTTPAIAHQNAAAKANTPLGVFDRGELIELVTSDDLIGEAARQRAADRLGRPVETLITCPQHPTIAAVDCVICVPVEAA